MQTESNEEMDELLPAGPSTTQPNEGSPTDELELQRAAETRNALKRNFAWFSLIASLNHALTYVVTAFAASLLPLELGGLICGITWSLNALSGLTVATIAVRRLGWKMSIVISFWGYSLQIVSLYLAIVYPEYSYIVGAGGAVLAGVTSAIWWTAQGVCFELTSSRIAESHLATTAAGGEGPRYSSFDEAVNGVRSDLSAQWTIVYQLSDIMVFLSLSVIPIMFPSIPIVTVLSWICVLGVCTAILGVGFDDLGDKGVQLNSTEVVEALLAVPHQFQNDSRAMLLAPFVFGFGITTAMFSYYINGNVVSRSENLGNIYIGILESFSYLVAAASAYPYAYISNHMQGGQHVVFQFGSLSFLLSGVVVYLLPEDELSVWQVILLMRALYGLGRGVFEGACRAVYASLFTGPDLSTAFSGQTLLAGLSGGICFFAYGMMSREMIAAITVVNGFLALACYALLLSVSKMYEPLPWRALWRHILYILGFKSVDTSRYVEVDDDADMVKM